MPIATKLEEKGQLSSFTNHFRKTSTKTSVDFSISGDVINLVNLHKNQVSHLKQHESNYKLKKSERIPGPVVCSISF